MSEVFQLAVYSCVSVFMPMSTDLAEKTCRWDRRELYAQQQTCAAAGEAEVGKPILSFIREDRKVERFTCNSIGVRY